MENTYVSVPQCIQTPEPARVIEKPVDYSNWIQYASTSSSNSNIQWTFTTPSTASLLRPKVHIKLDKLAVIFNLDNLDGSNATTPFPANSLALRSFSLAKLISNCSVLIGNNQINVPLSDIEKAYEYCSADFSDLVDVQSMSGYRDELGGAYPTIATQPGGSLMNSLAGIQNQTPGSVSYARGGLNILKVDNSQLTANQKGQNRRVDFKIADYLYFPLFNWARKQGYSMTNLSQVQVNLTLNPISSVFCYNAPNIKCNSIQFDTTNGISQTNCVLNIQYVTLPPSMSPKAYSKNFIDIQRFITNTGTTITKAPTLYDVATQGGLPVASATISLSVVPDKLIIFATVPRSVRYGDVNYTKYNDGYYIIRSLRIQLGNRAGLLSNASQESLWLNSMEAGMKNVSYSQMLGYTAKFKDNSADGYDYQALAGCPIVIDVASHLGLSSDLTPGRSVPLSIFVQANIVNQGAFEGLPSADIPELTILALNNAEFTVSESGSSVVTLGGVTEEQTAMVQAISDNSPETKYVNHMPMTLAGGDFMSSIKDMAKKVLPIVKSVSGSINKGLESMGYGAGAGFTGGKKHNMKSLAM